MLYIRLNTVCQIYPEVKFMYHGKVLYMAPCSVDLLSYCDRTCSV